MEKTYYKAQDSSAMRLCGQQIAEKITPPYVIYLTGDLGAGKTTLVQGMLQYFDYTEIVSSPSYNLIHQYPTKLYEIAHLDLYRLEDPEELAMLGLVDLLTSNSILCVEWPEKGAGFLPEADLLINIQYQTSPETGRVIQLKSSH